MQREIKFKAKSQSDRRWLIGDLAHTDGRVYIIPFDPNELDSMDRYEVDPDTICQFTGLYDRDGNEVWEHDIVRVVKESFSFGQFEYVNEIAWAEKGGWHPMGTACDNIKDFLTTISGKNVAKVIGDRFDNPELLNE